MTGAPDLRAALAIMLDLYRDAGGEWTPEIGGIEKLAGPAVGIPASRRASAAPTATQTINTATKTGLVDLLTPDPASIDPTAMAEGLAKINRWSGASDVPLSVAQHSVLVYDIFRMIAPAYKAQAIYALLHDGHEYITGDVSRPLEQALEALQPGAGAALLALKAYLDAAIRRRFRLPEPSAAVLAMVHEADLCAADAEWARRIPTANGPSPFRAWRAKYPVLRGGAFVGLGPLSWPDAATRFLEKLHDAMQAHDEAHREPPAARAPRKVRA